MPQQRHIGIITANLRDARGSGLGGPTRDSGTNTHGVEGNARRRVREAGRHPWLGESGHWIRNEGPKVGPRTQALGGVHEDLNLGPVCESLSLHKCTMGGTTEEAKIRTHLRPPHGQRHTLIRQLPKIDSCPTEQRP